MKGPLVYGCLLGLGLGALVIGALALYHPATPAWGVVDMGVVMSKVSQNLAKTYPQGQVPKGVMESTLKEIKTCLEGVAHETNMALLSKSAVLSGSLPDYTSAVLQALEATP